MNVTLERESDRLRTPQHRPQTLIPGDDLAFAAIIFRRIEQITGLSPHQEFRAPRLDDVVAPAPRRGFLGQLLRKLREREDLAPDPPGDFDFIGIRTDAERYRQGRIAMDQHQRLGIVGPAQRDALEITDADNDRHSHAADGTAQNDTFAMQFDLPHTAIRAGVVRIEANGQ